MESAEGGTWTRTACATRLWNVRVYQSCLPAGRFTTWALEVNKFRVENCSCRELWTSTQNFKLLVPRTGFEPAHLAALPPQSSVSTSPACRQAGSPLGLEKLKSSEFWDQSFGCMRELWTSNYWCPELDSNQHTLRHYPLKVACLPILPAGRQVHHLGFRS